MLGPPQTINQTATTTRGALTRCLALIPSFTVSWPCLGEAGPEPLCTARSNSNCRGRWPSGLKS